MMDVFPSERWMAGFREAANADRELAVIGSFFTVDFAIAFGENRYVMAVIPGALTNDRSGWVGTLHAVHGL